jgi:hypothetical protein
MGMRRDEVEPSELFALGDGRYGLESISNGASNLMVDLRLPWRCCREETLVGEV